MLSIKRFVFSYHTGTNTLMECVAHGSVNCVNWNMNKDAIHRLEIISLYLFINLLNHDTYDCRLSDIYQD